MKVLLVGTGGVGESIVMIAKDRPWVEQVVMTDYSKDRLKEVQKKVGDKDRFPIEWIDANKQGMIEKLAKKYEVDLIMNACDPSFNEPIFDAAYEVGCTYMDMAMTLSSPHPKDPYNKCGV
ncbi:MAG: saccharopine dehydrogenase NADP-binding domain-containing protein, partial [Anaerolineales bacterium]|nr:saccharopine dehydrogenase NADP-binding domain-containing protein [Anaerolineales bacterium]